LGAAIVELCNLLASSHDIFVHPGGVDARGVVVERNADTTGEQPVDVSHGSHETVQDGLVEGIAERLADEREGGT
jgi:hypothetical protein